jgi:hypothetical protein
MINALHSISEITPERWECLGPREFYETHAWLAANESTLSGEPLVTVESDGPYLRSAVVWQGTDINNPSPYYNINALLERFQVDSLPTGPAESGWTLNFVGVGPHEACEGAGLLVVQSSLPDFHRGVRARRPLDPARGDRPGVAANHGGPARVHDVLHH